MPLIELEIVAREPFDDGREFGETGAYERIDAIAHYTVDPGHAANQGVVDLDKALRDPSGRVRFSGDATFLVPVDAQNGNRAVLLEVPNRGNRLAQRTVNLPVPDLSEPPGRIDPGDGFLFKRGWSLAWCGWQWDVPRSAARMGFEAPIVPNEVVDADAHADARMQIRFQPNTHRADLPLTDQHVGVAGNHQRIAPADIDDSSATLWVRDGIYGSAAIIAREQWQFAHDERGRPVADEASVWLDGGFEAGRIYDLVYRPATCRVVGAGLLAVRDFAAYLKSEDNANPLAGYLDHVIGEGQSQCGRFLRTYLHRGLNVDEAGQQALDGVLIHVAGGRRGEFNHRYGQPSVQPTPSFGHLFPFADEAQTDPASGVSDGLLDRQRMRGGVPRIFQTDTSSEYWRGDASLAHIDAATGEDVQPPDEVRRYLFASTQHGAGAALLNDASMFGTRGANCFNIIDYRPLFRAALVNLLEWLRGTEPPPSVFPRAANGTAASREAVAAKLERICRLNLPDASALARIRPLDLGRDAAAGVGSFPATVAGDPYPCIVSDVDDDGNETGGIRMPDVAAPIGTHTGFNPRHPETGGAGQLLDYLGSTAPFDLRRVRERYATRDDYLARVRSAAQALVAERYLLAEDVDLCVENAGARYDAILRP